MSLEEVKELFVNGDYAATKTVIDELLSQDNSHELLLFASKVYYSVPFAEAEDLINSLAINIELLPLRPIPYEPITISLSSILNDNTLSAVRFAEQSLELAASTEERIASYNQLIYVYCSTGDDLIDNGFNEQGVRYLSKAVEYSECLLSVKQDVESYYFLIRSLLAFQDFGNYDGRINELLNEVFEFDVEASIIDLLVNNNRLDLVINYGERLIEQYPESIDVLCNLSEAYLDIIDLGDVLEIDDPLGKAYRHAKNAYELEPKNPQTIYHLLKVLGADTEFVFDEDPMFYLNELKRVDVSGNFLYLLSEDI